MKQKIQIIFSTLLLLAGFLTGCIDDKNVSPDNVTNADTPTFSDVTHVSRTATTITLEGTITAFNGYPVTECGICWGTSPQVNIQKDSHKSMTNSSSETISLIADGLQSNTLYYFRLYAKNKAGVGYSKEDTIRTGHGLGIVRTYIVRDSVRATTVIAGGVIDLRGEGLIQERGVYYSDSANMASKITVISQMQTDSFNCKLTGLKPSTKYYVQAYVKNEFGIFTGGTENFTTGTGLPRLSDELTIKPESNKAKVTSTVLSAGDAPITQMGFCWSMSPTHPTIANDTLLVVINGDGTGSMTGDIQPLVSDQKYYVRAFAENAFGIVYSLPIEFSTTRDIPTVSVVDISIVSEGSVQVRGRVLDIGTSNVTRVGICYAPYPTVPRIPYNPRVETVLFTPVSHAPYDFSGVLTGLKGETTYYICAYATNSSGVLHGYSDPQIFTTPPIFTLESGSFDGGSRVEGSCAYFTIGNKGYLLGGDKGPNYANNLHSYNPLVSSNKWGELWPYVGGNMKWLSTAVIDTRVFVLGGLKSGNVASNDFYVYTTAGNTWSPKPFGPDSAYLRAGFTLNNEVGFVGGMKDTANCEVWGYNAFSDTWSRKADFPVKQYGGIAVTIDNIVYAGLGKNTGGVGYLQLWKSSGTLSSWTPEPINTSLSGNILVGTVFDDKIYVIDKPANNTYRLYEYNPATQVWRRLSDLPGGSYSWEIQFMYTIQNRIYIGFANGDKVVSYNPLWDN